MLDRIRPKPVITSVGLSPRVTKTLQEMGLALDLSTVRVPPVEKIGERPRIDENTGLPAVTRYGKPIIDPIYKVMWSAGTQFGLSRFRDSDCEACGKRIPSNLYVPIEVEGRSDGKPVHVGLLVGVDCAANIFGVRDKGYKIG